MDGTLCLGHMDAKIALLLSTRSPTVVDTDITCTIQMWEPGGERLNFISNITWV